ncbi:MAG: hypothetical protein C4534_10010 [Gaiellales bacterium]|nr:MAG: hypothetical protein C4534_10010 [Gaiellales bacterium]
MLTKWRLSNFKCFKREHELELGRLTLIAGANNAGKSMLLKSLLLVCQSMFQKEGNADVIANGHLTRLGRLVEPASVEPGIVHDASMRIGWEWRRGRLEGVPEPEVYDNHGNGDRIRHRKGGLDLDIGCDIMITSVSKLLGPFTVASPPRISSFSVWTERHGDERVSLSASNDEEEPADESCPGCGHAGCDGLHEGDARGMRITCIDERSAAELDDDFIEGELCGCDFQGLLPAGLRVRFDRRKQAAAIVELALLRVADPALAYNLRRMSRHLREPIEIPAGVIDRIAAAAGVEFRRDGTTSGVISILEWHRAVEQLEGSDREALEAATRRLFADEAEWGAIVSEIEASEGRELEEDDETHPQMSDTSVWLPGPLRMATGYLRDYFTSMVKYIGPLRQSPRLYHELPEPAADGYVGSMGEHAIAILGRNLDRRVTFMPPENFDHPGIKMAAKVTTLREAVSAWLVHFGMGELVAAFDAGKPGYGFLLRLPGSRMLRDPESVGVGISQLLPVLVMCLLAEEHSTLIIEQPELHLHPGAQSKLGDFFLSMALLNRQCILETHSEHLMERVNYRVAASNDALVPLVKNYFVEAVEDGSVVDEAPLNRHRNIVHWPEGFYDEVHRQEEALLRVRTGYEPDALAGEHDPVRNN